MGNTPRQLPKRFHLLNLAERLFELHKPSMFDLGAFAVRDVARSHGQPHDLTIVISYGCQPQLGMSRLRAKYWRPTMSHIRRQSGDCRIGL